MTILSKKLELIDEQKSPLFRIMSIYNADEPSHRAFDNNICAFHVGDGYILSVAHNLRTVTLPAFLPENVYQSDIIHKIDPSDVVLFDANYVVLNNHRKLQCNNPAVRQQLTQKLNSIKFDGRFLTLYGNGACKPFLIIQFRNGLFYNNPELTAKINPSHLFHEPLLFRHTFLLELELVKAFYSEDIALYKIVNTDADVTQALPSVGIDFKIYNKLKRNFYCLQCAPMDNLGRLLNSARTEGLLDQWSNFIDPIGGNYAFEGLRYLIEGYFRFGSSGAPYLKYSFFDRQFKVNAIQSEASPIQLAINHSRNGNFQYVNAIAAPLKNIESELNILIKRKK